MALQLVTVIRRAGEAPRTFVFDDAPNSDGSPGRGASMIETLKRQVRREDLHSITVEPIQTEAPTEAAKPARRAKAADEAPTA